MSKATCSKCLDLSINLLRSVNYLKPHPHHDNVGELQACAEASPHCGICRLLWCTMDTITRQDSSKPAIRDSPDKTYGLYAELYDDFDFKFGTRDLGGGLPSYESTIKIEAGFLTYNIGLARIGIRIFALEDSPAGKHFSERCTYFDPNPGLSVKLGRKWLDTCLEYHKRCRPTASTMPTRVIALGSPGSETTRLLIAKDLQEPYVALSYCWGRGALESLMLHDNNLESMQQGIDEERLVKTYREAFQVARQLGFWYIWIDALCIIQGSKQDWEYESARMGSVYGNASLTIVAARSSDSKDGFLQNNFKPAVKPSPVSYGRVNENGCEIDGLYVGLNRNLFESTLQPEPVQTRGWCLQEAELSRRQLVFGNHGVSFLCKESILYEDEIWKSERPQDVYPKGEFSLNSENRPSIDRYEILNHWYAEILPNYSARALTDPGDIFAAISSLAVIAQQTIKGRYLAGLWESDLPRGLLWKPRYQIRWMIDPSQTETSLTPLRRPANPQAPSWSWAAVQGPIQHGWDNKKRWPSYPTLNRADQFLVRPLGDDHTRWTSQDDCDAHVIRMPHCELLFYGHPRRVRRAATSQERLIEWFTELGYRFRYRPDDLPPQSRGTIIFEPGLEQRQGDESAIEQCPFERAVGYGVFDIVEEEVEEVWALALSRRQGILVGKIEEEDGMTFRRLGIFHVLNVEWFKNGEEVVVRLV